jgi:tetrahydromethanopterin S-methyltransferase subunit A
MIVATEPTEPVVMDKAGYFVILPLADQRVLHVEHYAYDNTLLRVIDGANARSVYTMIITNGWVSELSHAAYLGKELAKGELALEHGFKYVQDGA